MFDRLDQDSDARSLRIFAIVCFILFAACVRVLPHPWNFTPVGAMALFGGAKLRNPWAAFLFPLSALFFGDVTVGVHRFSGFYQVIPIVYLSFCVSVLIGRLFRNRQSPLGLSAATLLGATQFFLVTNFPMWVFFDTYAKTPAGLLRCYVAGIPFFGNTLLSDSLYVVVLFGGFALVERLSPALRVVESRRPA
jgi:Family of unknown function (DUF6580)